LPQQINQKLKIVAATLGMKDTLKTGLARKAFAQHLLDTSFHVEDVAILLGHSKPDITRQHYARIAASRVVRKLRNAI
jgi:site-specific recombinase XerD